MNATQLLEHFDRLAEVPGAVPRLRRFILDLAVRGKLVEQDAGDEPASKLLKRIQTLKRELIFAKVLKKGTAPLVTMGGETPFALPDGWAISRLGDVYDVRDGTHATPKYVEVGFPLITSKNLSSGRLDFADVKLISKADHEEISQRSRVARNDILFAMIGSIGNPVIVDSDTSFSIKNVALFKYYEPALSNSRFLLLFLRQSAVAMRTGATGGLQPFVSLGMLRNSPIPLPPLAEQHRIVAKVDELMALCDQLEAAQQERERRRDRLTAASLQRLNRPAADTTLEGQREHARFHLNHLPRLITRPEHIKAMRQMLSSLAIRGRLVEQDLSDEPANKLLQLNARWRSTAITRKQIREPRKELAPADECDPPYRLPTSWAWARLGEVIYIQSGDGLTAVNMKAGSVPVFGGNGINGYHDSFNVDEPTLVIGRVGYYCGSIHITPDKAWITDNAFVTHYCPDLFSLRFLALLLATTNLKENEGATAQPVISGSKIYPLIVGIPPLAEQHRIVAKVDQLMALCDQLEAQFTTTQTDSRRLLEAVLEAALAPA